MAKQRRKPQKNEKMKARPLKLVRVSGGRAYFERMNGRVISATLNRVYHQHREKLDTHLQGVLEIKRKGKNPELIYVVGETIVGRTKQISLYTENKIFIGAVNFSSPRKYSIVRGQYNNEDYRFIEGKYQGLGLSREAYDLVEQHLAAKNFDAVRTTTRSKRNAAMLYRRGYRGESRKENEAAKKLSKRRQQPGTQLEKRIRLKKKLKGSRTRDANLGLTHRLKHVDEEGNTRHLNIPIKRRK